MPRRVLVITDADLGAETVRAIQTLLPQVDISCSSLISDAVSAIADESVVAVVVDGFDPAARRLIAERPINADLPLMLLALPLTAGELRAEAFRAGWDEILTAPFEPHECAFRIRSLTNYMLARRDAAAAQSSGRARHALMAVGANDGLWDWDLTTGRVYYSPRWKAMLGFAEHEINDSIEDWLSHILPEDLDWVDATLEAQIEAPTAEFRIEYRMRDRNGKVRWMLCRGVAIADHSGGRAQRMAGSMTDITDRKEAEEALRASEERYSLAIQAAKDGLFDWNLVDNTILFTPRWKEMIGYADTEIGTDPNEWFDRVNEDGLLWLQAMIETQIQLPGEPFQIEYRIRHKEGGERWMLCHGMAIRDLNGKTARIVGSQSDISTRKAAEAQVLHDAFHDGLTGLPNRALFIDRIKQALRRVESGQSSTAVMLVEVNRFSNLADTLGPAGADQVLINIAQRLNTAVDSGDTLARLEGALFGVLFEDVASEADVEARARLLHDALGQPVPVDGGRTVYVTARMGATLPQDTNTRPEDMMRDAGRALHRASGDPAAAFALFNTDSEDGFIDPLELEQELRRAIEAGGQLELHYQPIFDLTHGRLAGFESLIRWTHPRHGMISPARFIPIAEETKLIIPIGEWVMAEACRQLAVWRQRFPEASDLFVNVNVSGVQMKAPDFIDRIAAILAESGVPDGAIKLEITESVILDDAQQTIDLLERLRAMKLKLAIDDFGTGYSSLSYLHRFRFDAVKIDQSFVRAMQVKDENALIIRMIAELSRGLGSEVIAEGIESGEDAERLGELGCMFGQGYHFGRPRDATATERLIIAERCGATALQPAADANGAKASPAQHQSTPHH